MSDHRITPTTLFFATGVNTEHAPKNSLWVAFGHDEKSLLDRIVHRPVSVPPGTVRRHRLHISLETGQTHYVEGDRAS